MTTSAWKLLETALALSPHERAELAARLIDSLDTEADDDLDAAWDAEIGRRIAQMDQGSAPTVPWPEARRMILGKADSAPRD